tara:strand:+ start:791 stop:1231 length:441 start_codon:yes stop_codon:yes gene_type:complete
MPKFKKNTSSFQMKGWSGYQNSPLRQDTTGKETDQPYSIEHQQNIDGGGSSETGGTDLPTKTTKHGTQGMGAWYATKKIGGKVIKRLGTKLLGPVGILSGLTDLISIGGRWYHSGDLGTALEDWWYDDHAGGYIATPPRKSAKDYK